MKVLMLSTNADNAGAPMHVMTLLKSLKSEVEFCTVFGEPGPVADYARNEQIWTYILPRMRSSISPLNDAIALFQLLRIVRKFKPDLIHCHSSKAGMLGRLASLFFSIPSLYTVHGWGWRGLGRVGSSLVIAIEKTLKFVPNSRFIFVAHSVEAEARHILSIPQNQGIVIHNGTPSYFVEGVYRKQPALVMAARVCVAKDHETLVRAYDNSRLTLPLVLCGEGTRDDLFIDACRAWAPHRFRDITFLGARNDIPELLSISGYFALISNFEALPLSVIEAMSAACCVIASNIGGVSELISHNQNGILVPKGDVCSLTAILDELDSQEFCLRIAKCARESYLKSFTCEHMAGRTLSTYRLSLGKI